MLQHSNYYVYDLNNFPIRATCVAYPISLYLSTLIIFDALQKNKFPSKHIKQ